MQKYNQVDDSSFKMYDKQNFITTGCPKLDYFLRGGLYRKGITQIYGEAGTGKTQLALQMCLAAQIPLENSYDFGGVAYICTESVFPSNRLHELLKKSSLTKQHFISNEMIFIEHVTTFNELENCIFNSHRLPQLISKFKIRLLVIDSIAAIYRAESKLNNFKNRAKSLRNIGYFLQKLTYIHKIAVLCLNQVTASIENLSIGHDLFKEQPSLGITWASMITNSLYMSKSNGRRFLYTKGSPYLPYKCIEYEILDTGVKARHS